MPPERRFLMIKEQSPGRMDEALFCVRKADRAAAAKSQVRRRGGEVPFIQSVFPEEGVTLRMGYGIIFL